MGAARFAIVCALPPTAAANALSSALNAARQGLGSCLMRPQAAAL